MGCSQSLVTNDKASIDKRLVENSQQLLTEEQMQQLLKMRFNRKQILDWHQVFVDKFDLHKTKSSYATAHIQKAAFIDYFKQLHPNGDVSRLTDYFFHMYDINGDGVIDFMEFMQAISKIQRGDLTERLSMIFSLLDSNHEGYIDRLKLVKMMEALYNMKGINYKDSYNVLLRKVDSFITRLDDNNKERGRIVRYKFIESCMNDPILKDVLSAYK